MKKITLLFVLTFTLLFTFAAFAQLDRSVAPPAGPAPKIQLADYKTFELPNGLKVIVVENNKQPVVSFSLLIDRDPILEGQNAGYASLAGELLRTGTATRTKDKIDKDIDFIGGTLKTSSESVFASSLKKHVDALLNIMSDVVLNANFTQSEFDKLVKQEKSGLAAQKDEPNSIAGVVLKKILYGKSHPYSESMTEATLNTITLDMCKEYYKTYYKPNYAYLAIVGNISESEAKTLAEKYFGKWEKGEKKSFTYETPSAPLVTKVSIVDRENAVQSTIRVGYALDIKPGSEDDIKARVTNTILGGGVFRLFENLREKHAYTYGAYSSLTTDRLIGKFVANTEARNEVTDSSIAQILFEMKRIRNEAVSDKELQKAKNYLSGSFAIALENPQTIASFAINTDRYNFPKDYYANYLQNVAKVTAEDVQNIAQKYILPDQANILVVGKASDIADKLKKFTISKIDYYDISGEKYDPAAQKAPEGITAKTVIDKYLNAIGGVEKLKTIVDKKTNLTASMQGMTINITLTQKAPNKFAQTISFSGMEQKIIFDGVKGVQAAQGQSTELTGDALESLKFESTLDLVYNLDKYGVKANLVSVEKVNGKDAFKIELTLPSGKKWLHYYDAETGFKVKESKTLTAPQGVFDQTIEFSDYRESDGIKYPFKYVQNVGPQTLELTVTSIETNKGVSDNTFDLK
jgi:zinc protease